jgi:hypothetical protein
LTHVFNFRIKASWVIADKSASEAITNLKIEVKSVVDGEQDTVIVPAGRDSHVFRKLGEFAWFEAAITQG